MVNLYFLMNENNFKRALILIIKHIHFKQYELGWEGDIDTFISIYFDRVSKVKYLRENMS